MNALAKTEDTQALAHLTDYAAEATSAGLAILKFKRGTYELGVNGEEIKQGSEFAVNVTSLIHEWLKWIEGQPVDRRIAVIKNGDRLPGRDELGDVDPALWPKDLNGVPTDPWAKSRSITMRNLETGEECCFATSSIGGFNAIDKLINQSSFQIRKASALVYPIIELEGGTYFNKKIKDNVLFPIFRVKAFKTEAELLGNEEPKKGFELDDAINF